MWQVVVYALVTGGIFVYLFELFGIPWNSFGAKNVFGTLMGWMVLELPAVLLLIWFGFSTRKKQG